MISLFSRGRQTGMTEWRKNYCLSKGGKKVTKILNRVQAFSGSVLKRINSRRPYGIEKSKVQKLLGVKWRGREKERKKENENE